MESPPWPCSAIKSLSILPYSKKELLVMIKSASRISAYQAAAPPLLFNVNLFQTYSKLLDSHSRGGTERAAASSQTKKTKRKPAPKVLVLLDYDDTLIPSTLIRQKGRITERSLSEAEREALELYVHSVNEFVDTLLCLFDNNRERNIKIVSNGSTSWVSNASFYHSGSLFAQLMRPLHTKLVESHIDIISAHEHKARQPAKFADISLQRIKPYLMKLLFYEYFGRKLTEKEHDIKIVSIGDSACEFHAAATALKYYLKEQSQDVLDSVNVSLHRIKFVSKPDSFTKLGDELKWCTRNMHEIVHDNHASKDYYL